MADVRFDPRPPAGDRGRSGDGGRDRGQLILVTGLAIAVMLVALVLLLNTVIYTQNLATRGPKSRTPRRSRTATRSSPASAASWTPRTGRGTTPGRKSRTTSPRPSLGSTT
ncbi:DUF7261 family protein [Halorussus caseinilyticus]|uniref:Uncharacterized protein n=1 Tax=Halorussus caseinilyticus TaxID=3034025 RepID=A0ABD5WJD2_9EURY